MASKEALNSDVCPTCSQKVDIYNGDFNFSMDLHMQSHKSLEIINREIDEQQRSKKFESNNRNTVHYNSYLVHNNNEKIVNNYVNFTNTPQTSNYLEVETKSASLSGINKTSMTTKDIASHPKPQPPSISLLDKMFNLIPHKLKLHKEFFSENKDGLAFCKICNVTVEPVIKISEHLKTKLHENNIVQVLTSTLPVELHHVMEFVSFYQSNLCCNLCGLIINSCFTYPSETMLSITLHNLSTGHLEKMTSNTSIGNVDRGWMIIKSLAKLNPLISNNQHLLDFKMQPEFWCKLCNLQIGWNLNERELYTLFNEHFLSKKHLNSVGYSELAAFNNRSDIVGKERHNFIVANCKIYCTVCKMYVEPKLQALIWHIKQLPHNKLSQSSEIIDNKQPKTSQAFLENNVQTATCLEVTNKHTTLSDKVAQENKTEMLSSLRRSLSQLLQDNDCIIETNKGEIICLTCNFKIPPSSYNLETHLFGKKHKKMAEKLKPNSAAKIICNLGEQRPDSSDEKASFKHPTSKEENPQPKTFQASLENNLQTTTCLKVTNNQTTLSDKVAQENITGTLPSLPSALPQLPQIISLDEETLFIQPISKQELYCKVCNINVPSHKKVWKNHIKEDNHMKLVLLELSKTNETIKKCITHIKIKEGRYNCRLCNVTITDIKVKQSLKSDILNHMSGKHLKKCVGKVIALLLEELKTSEIIVKANSLFLEISLENEVYCKLCSSDIVGSCKKAALRKNILSHLTGSVHTVNVNNFNCNSTVLAKYHNICSSVTELLKYVLHYFKDDIPYIKRASSKCIVVCTVCQCPINSLFLIKHLNDKNHNQMKALKIESLSHSKTIERRQSVRTIGSLCSGQ